MDVCPRCGKPLHEEARYCWYCGLFLLDPILPELLRITAQEPVPQETADAAIPAEAERNAEESLVIPVPMAEIAAEPEQSLPEADAFYLQPQQEIPPEAIEVCDIAFDAHAEETQEVETAPEAEEANVESIGQESTPFEWSLPEFQPANQDAADASTEPEEVSQDVAMPELAAEEVPQAAESEAPAAQENTAFDWSILDFLPETPAVSEPEPEAAAVEAPQVIAEPEPVAEPVAEPEQEPVVYEAAPEVTNQQNDFSFDWLSLPQESAPAAEAPEAVTAEEVPPTETFVQPETVVAPAAEPAHNPVEAYEDVTVFAPPQQEPISAPAAKVDEYNAVTERMPRVHSASAGMPVTDTISATEALPRNPTYGYQNGGQVASIPHTENLGSVTRKPVDDIPYTEPLPRSNTEKAPEPAAAVPQTAMNDYSGQQNNQYPPQGNGYQQSGGYRPQGGYQQGYDQPQSSGNAQQNRYQQPGNMQGNAAQNPANGYRQNTNPQARPSAAPTADDVLNFYRSVLRFNDQMIAKSTPGAQALVRNLVPGETLEFVAPGSILGNRTAKAVTLAATNQRILIVDAARKLPGILAGLNNSSVLSIPYPTIVNLDASQALQQGILILQQADGSRHPLAFERPWLEFIYNNLRSVILRHRQRG